MAYSFQEQQRDNYRISLWVEFSRSGARCRWAVSSNPGLLAGHHLSNPHRPMDTSAARPPHLSAVDTPRDKFLWNVLSRPDLRDGNWAWTAIEADCGGFPDCRNSCGAACGLPPIGAILTSDGANPGLQGAGSVSGRRSSYTFMYCPYYPTAAHSLPDRSPGKRNCNHCESCWIRTSDLMKYLFRRKTKLLLNW